MLFSGCLKEDSFKLKYTGLNPRAIQDDWQISTPEDEQVNRYLLEKAYELVYNENRYLGAKSLLVFRNGKLIAEAYPNNLDDINKINNIQSCTKSITSIGMGIAIQNGAIDSLTEQLYDIYPMYFDEDISKRSITIQDALTMRTGLKFDNDVHTLDLYQTTGNSVEYVLAQPQLYPSGSFTNYNDGAPHLVSKVVEQKVNQPLAEYVDDKLFKVLNIKDWLWEKSKDNTTFGAFSLYLKPRDFGKIGQLLLQKGVWSNTQIIDSSYLAEATSIQTSANFHSEPYGYYFWILPAYKGYCALGHGGQFLFIAPDKNLVIVYTAMPYTNSDFFDERNQLMEIIYRSCL